MRRSFRKSFAFCTHVGLRMTTVNKTLCYYRGTLKLLNLVCLSRSHGKPESQRHLSLSSGNAVRRRHSCPTYLPGCLRKKALRTKRLTQCPAPGNLPKLRQYIMFNMNRKDAHLRQERFLRLYELYCDGLTYEQIGQQEGITRERVRQILHKGCTTEEFKKLKEMIDNRRSNTWRNKEIEHLLSVGNSCPQIAKLLGISVDAVKRVSAKRSKRLKAETVS